MIRPCSLRRLISAATLFAATLGLAGAAGAQTIVDEWNTATVPPPPALKAVTLDPKTTAFLALDFLKQNCAPQPRCVASLPLVKALLTTARGKGVVVVYSFFPGAQISDTLPEIAPQAGEPFVSAKVDKFLNTDLDKILKAKGIKTVVVTGMVGNGAVLYTASEAAQLGYNVVVPVDCMPAPTTYIQQYVTFQLSNAPTVANMVTLTRANMVTF
jgi:nicotinamidase-related amidase